MVMKSYHWLWADHTQFWTFNLCCQLYLLYPHQVVPLNMDVHLRIHKWQPVVLYIKRVSNYLDLILVVIFTKNGFLFEFNIHIWCHKHGCPRQICVYMTMNKCSLIDSVVMKNCLYTLSTNITLLSLTGELSNFKTMTRCWKII